MDQAEKFKTPALVWDGTNTDPITMPDYSDKIATFADAGFESGTVTCGARIYASSSAASTIDWITLTTAD